MESPLSLLNLGTIGYKSKRIGVNLFTGCARHKALLAHGFHHGWITAKKYPAFRHTVSGRVYDKKLHRNAISTANTAKISGIECLRCHGIALK